MTKINEELNQLDTNVIGLKDRSGIIEYLFSKTLKEIKILEKQVYNKNFLEKKLQNREILRNLKSGNFQGFDFIKKKEFLFEQNYEFIHEVFSEPPQTIAITNNYQYIFICKL